MVASSIHMLVSADRDSVTAAVHVTIDVRGALEKPLS
jgi:hypothetical protein